MPQVLELAQLINKHGMAKMQIGSGRVEAGLDPKAGHASAGTSSASTGISSAPRWISASCSSTDFIYRVLPNCQIEGTNHTRSQTKNKFCRPSGVEPGPDATFG